VSHQYLAQVNVGRILAPLEDPIMDGFRTRLDPINGLADRSPGFVWRLKGDSGNAMDIQAFDDPLMAINLSVWDSLDALKAFVYRTDHVALLKDRRQWFQPPDGPVLALWWVPRDHLPDAAEALQRLAHLKAHGPTPHAFTFRRPFGPEGVAALAPPANAAQCHWAT
jgi:hypothetical protein